VKCRRWTGATSIYRRVKSALADRSHALAERRFDSSRLKREQEPVGCRSPRPNRRTRRVAETCPNGEAYLLFPACGGTPAHRSGTLQMGLYLALEKAKLRRVGTHSLRPFYASGFDREMRISHRACLTARSQFAAGNVKVYAHHVTNVSTDSLDGLALRLVAVLIAKISPSQLPHSRNHPERCRNWKLTLTAMTPNETLRPRRSN
jgi:hypothetical protein